MYVDLSQVNAFAADLGRVQKAAVPMAHRAVSKTALDIERDAKIFAPVDTGNLRNSISHDITTHASLAGGSIMAVVGPTAEYAPFLEYGTSRMAPQPFLGPAFDRNIGQLETALLSVVDVL